MSFQQAMFIVLTEKYVFARIEIKIQCARDLHLLTKKGLFMLVSKTKIALLLLSTLLFTAACSETKEESAEDAKQEMMTELEKAGEESSDMLSEGKDAMSEMAADAKDSATEMYEDAKDSASEMVDASSEKASELKDSAAEKVKMACIEAKKATGGNVADCE